MGFHSLILLCLLSFISSPHLLLAQQLYEGVGITKCESVDNSTSILGYTCNGQNTSCQSYLIFRSQTPYNSVSSISGLLASEPSQLSQINSVPDNATFQTDKEVIVPINCSCSGQYSQLNTSYTIRGGDTYFIVANNTYQGLSTCQALQNQNNVSARNLDVGMEITVPLRCACPTRNQTSDGVKYLLSYLVRIGDTVQSISQRFGVSQDSVLQANGLSVDSTIIDFTTLLVPLKNQPTSNQTITPPPPPSLSAPTPPSSDNNRSKKTWVYVVIGVAAGTFVLIALFVLFCIFGRRNRRADPVITSKDAEKDAKPTKKLPDSEGLMLGMSDIDRSLKVYTFEELKLATNNFSPEHRMKGSVYRGVIKGDMAAIKQMEGDVSNEIDILKRINHANLIRLSGICFDQGYWYLVYEYAENGPLSDWINDTRGSKVLSWTQRVQIALDVANGLNYLHSFTEPAHVHKDIKSSNILLDGDLRAKICNFRMAKSAEGEGTGFAFTRHIVGTKGYMAPEYLENGLVSPKLDVYAFGVVMLEIITGKEAIIASSGGDMLLSDALIAIFSRENATEKLCDLLDPALEGNYPLDLALNVAKLIKRCLSKDAMDRPIMGEVVQSLTKILVVDIDGGNSRTKRLLPTFVVKKEMNLQGICCDKSSLNAQKTKLVTQKLDIYAFEFMMLKQTKEE
ncbi:Protein kinase domain-containing protein [Cinnamomum micranthum f. kanehirae]|uniref:Protein kinase domain-containing protein n=1 Tax=Cinnamomum micranthum f. kanehirae TaxID=337451 RepID=A0A3S3NSC0_9MAGN|nr:Protein kinase domain-containing protein [Cinnamomum micranthum f. kanehirae]